MKELSELRKEIDSLDIELVEIFEERMKIALSIAEYKSKNNLQVLNKGREEEVIQNCKKHLNNKEFSIYLESFLRSLMDISKEVQKNFLDSNRETDSHEG